MLRTTYPDGLSDRKDIMTDEKIVIRGSTAADAESFPGLLIMSSSFLEGLLGDSADRVLKNMFRRKNNLFGHPHSITAEANGKTAGMLLSYGYQTKVSEELITGLLLFVEMKHELLMKLPMFVRCGKMMDFVVKGDHYISNLAVFPEFRGMGIASRMIAHAEAAAKKEGAQRLVLDTEKDHTAAIRLYEKIGFSIRREEYIDLDERKYFFRMSKPIV